MGPDLRPAGDLSRRWVWLLLLVPLLAFWWPVIGSHTISFNPLSQHGAGVLPLLDPAAGSFQDEPWIRYLAGSWRQGEFPVINQNNGLGAPLVASMQSGALYPMNAVAALLPLDSPQFFDWFAILHVLILTLGLYRLSRCYTGSRMAAALVAVSFSISLAVVYHVNMVHFRVFTWAPLLGALLVELGRGRSWRWRLPAIALVMWCLFSAGNPQEAIMDLLGLGCILAADLLGGRWTWRSATLVGAILILVILINAPCYFPYMAGIKQEVLYSVSTPGRSQLKADFPWFIDVIIPRGGGYAGAAFRENRGFVDFISAISPIWLIGLISFVYAFVMGLVNRGQSIGYLVLIFCAMIGLAKIAGIGPWEWLMHIPLLNGIRFTKYTTWILFVLVPVAAVGVSVLAGGSAPVDAPARQRGLRPFVVSLLIGLIVLGLVALVSDGSWGPNRSAPGFSFFVLGVVATVGMVLFLPWCLGTRWQVLPVSILLLAFAFLSQGPGWPVQRSYERAEASGPVTFQPADLSDGNWDHGVHRSAPAFFVRDASRLRLLSIGDSLSSAAGVERRVVKLVGDQVWMDGPVLDPLREGFPQAFTAAAVKERMARVDPGPSSYPRIADADIPNSNLLIGHVSPWVFDPILNATYRDWFIREFPVMHEGFWIQARADTALNQRQLDLLRLVGVGVIQGYGIVPDAHFESIAPQIHLVKQVVPEAVLVPESLVPGLEGLFVAGKYGELGDRLIAEGRACTLRRNGPNGIHIDLPAGAGPGRLIISRIFDPGWRGAAVVPFASTLLSCRVEAQMVVDLGYRPVGWSKAWGIALAGALLLLGLAVTLIVVDRRRKIPCPG